MSGPALDESERKKRRKRVQRLKKIIVILLSAAILIPSILCIVLFVRVSHLENAIKILQKEQKISISSNSLPEESVLETGEIQERQADYQISAHEMENPETGSVTENSVEVNSTKKVYLTFDDGPGKYTVEILDILREYGVHATFFVVGKTGEEYQGLYKRIVAEGHTIGMHSYSHDYGQIYVSGEEYRQDLEKLQSYVYDLTGVKSDICRFPGGSSNNICSPEIKKEILNYLSDTGITYYDWNISSQDATGDAISARQIAANVLVNVPNHGTSIVLLHEGTDKASTVESLPIIIETLQSMEQVEILPITDETLKIQHITLEKIEETEKESGGR